MIFDDVGLWFAVTLAACACFTASRPVGSALLRGAAAVMLVMTARLAYGFATEDWALLYVADHTRQGLPLPIRIAGLWAGPEGSLLLWTSMVATAAVLATRKLDDRTRARAVRLGAGLIVGFGGLVALVASPLERSGVPAIGGLGLQPVLEHPAMVWHPPILYAGLVGLLVPSLRGAAAMFAGKPAQNDHADSQTSLLVAMAVLTIGLATGALWAGVELGWGGYWAWDPIESAGLVAWLFGAAAIHAYGRTGRAYVPPSALAALLVAPGVAALWATTLTRVGLVSSVHAFADRPSLRLGLLVVAFVATAWAVAAVAVTLRSAKSALPTDEEAPPTPRRNAAVILAVCGIFVVAGAYEPLIEAATTGDAVAIAGSYYTRLLWPVTIVGAALIVRADRRWWWALAGAALGAASIPASAGPFAMVLAAGGGATAASAFGTARLPIVASGRPRSGRAGLVAHLGVGVVLVGIAGTVATTGSTVTVAVDESVEVDGMTVNHRSVSLVDGEATSEAVATVEVDGAVYRPRLVAYELRGVSTSETATRMAGLDEVQVQLVDGNDRAARYRIIRLPRVGLVWFGAVLVVAGLAAQPLRRFRAKSSSTLR